MRTGVSSPEQMLAGWASCAGSPGPFSRAARRPRPPPAPPPICCRGESVSAGRARNRGAAARRRRHGTAISRTCPCQSPRRHRLWHSSRDAALVRRHFLLLSSSCSAKHGGRPLAVAGAGREGVPAATVGVCRVRRGAAARVAVGVRVKGAPLRARRAPCVPERGVGATAAALPDGEFGGTNSGRIWRRARRPSVLSAMPKRFCLPARGPELRKCMQCERATPAHAQAV